MCLQIIPSMGIGGVETGVRNIAEYLHKKKIRNYILCESSKKNLKSDNLDIIYLKNLSFKNGDAEKIPFQDNSFDVILNVESSHCYGNMANFIAEVYRVLKPNGKFSWADLRASEAVKETEDIFNKSKLKIIKSETITDEVIKALDSIHDKKIEMINSYVPKIINNAFKDFAGVKDSKIYNSFKNGNAVYLSKVLQKVS